MCHSACAVPTHSYSYTYRNKYSYISHIFLILSIYLSTLTKFVASTPTGPGVCFGQYFNNEFNLFTTQHGAQSTNNNLFTLQTNIPPIQQNNLSMPIQSNCVYRLSVCSSNQQFSGFLVYVRKNSNHKHVGTISLYKSSSDSTVNSNVLGQSIQCDSDNGTSTYGHNNPNNKGPNLELQWTPTSDAVFDSNNGDSLIFDAYMVTGNNIQTASSNQWYLVSSFVTKSSVIVSSDASTCPPVPTGTLCTASNTNTPAPTTMDMSMGGMYRSTIVNIILSNLLNI